MNEILFTITVPVKYGKKEIDRAVFEVSVRGDKMYAKTLGNNAVSAVVDVTPLWSFFKEVYNPENRLTPTKPTSDDLPAIQDV